ncbi:MAG: hypothetical protein ACTS5F_01140 [Candidatus Hodgkinia cicadicola]
MFPFEHLTSVISNMSPSAAVKSLFRVLLASQRRLRINYSIKFSPMIIDWIRHWRIT